MNWVVMFLVSLFMPVVQPALQNGVQRLSARVQQVSAPAAPQPYIVYHNGQWWKYENNQWYVWSPTR